jgi:hypothetical protein
MKGFIVSHHPGSRKPLSSVSTTREVIDLRFRGLRNDLGHKNVTLFLLDSYIPPYLRVPLGLSNAIAVQKGQLHDVVAPDSLSPQVQFLFKYALLPINSSGSDFSG